MAPHARVDEESNQISQVFPQTDLLPPGFIHANVCRCADVPMCRTFRFPNAHVQASPPCSLRIWCPPFLTAACNRTAPARTRRPHLTLAMEKAGAAALRMAAHCGSSSVVKKELTPRWLVACARAQKMCTCVCVSVCACECCTRGPRQPAAQDRSGCTQHAGSAPSLS